MLGGRACYEHSSDQVLARSSGLSEGPWETRKTQGSRFLWERGIQTPHSPSSDLWLLLGVVKIKKRHECLPMFSHFILTTTLWGRCYSLILQMKKLGIREAELFGIIGQESRSWDLGPGLWTLVHYSCCNIVDLGDGVWGGWEGWEKRERSHYNQKLIPCLPPRHIYIQSTPPPALSFTWSLHKTKRARFFLLLYTTRGWRRREVKWLAQGHTALEWQTRVEPRSSCLIFISYTVCSQEVTGWNNFSWRIVGEKKKHMTNTDNYYTMTYPPMEYSVASKNDGYN